MSLHRLLMVCEPGEYGVLMYLRKLIGHLQETHPDLAIDYAYSSRRGSPQLQELIASVETRGGRTIDLAVGNGPEPADFAAAGQLRRLVRDGRPDLIHAHSTKAGALTRLLALAERFPPILYSPHGYYGMARRGGLKEAVFNGVEMALGRKGWTHNVSPYERAFARQTLRLPEASLILVTTGINRSTFQPVSDDRKMELRRTLGLPERGRLLVTVGREGYEKNQVALYRALPRALTGEGLFFAHAGDGSQILRDSLDPATREKVTVFPFLERPEHLLQAADGFIMTSRSEAFGLAAYEALCCGLPLILPATTGLLTLRDLPFEGIQWLPNPAEQDDITDEIVAAVQRWAGQGAWESSAQVEEAGRWFDERVQFGKLTDVYRRLATGQPPQNPACQN